MKKEKSLTSVISLVLIFVCVLSCDEQEKLNTKNGISSGSANSRIGSPAFDGSEGDPLDLATAKKWAANYRSTLEEPESGTLAHYFGFEIIQQILSESDCVGIRIYYALDDNGEKKLILVGVDSNGDNLLPTAGGRLADDGNILADFSFPCPNTCPPSGL
jgi:hypothetical protein